MIQKFKNKRFLLAVTVALVVCICGISVIIYVRGQRQQIHILYVLLDELQNREMEIQGQIEDLHQELEGRIEGLYHEMEDAQEAKAQAAFQEFKQREGYYLIENTDDFYRLIELVNSGGEVENGVPAAEGAYRLASSLKLDITKNQELVKLGTREYPFQGVLDGDGHTISGWFSAPYLELMPNKHLIGYGDGQCRNLVVKNLFMDAFTSASEDPEVNDQYKVLFRELLDQSFFTTRSSTPQQLYLRVESQEECDELAVFLQEHSLTGEVHINLSGMLDTEKLAKQIYEDGNMSLVILTWGNPRELDEEDAKEADATAAGVLKLFTEEEQAACQEGAILYSFQKQKFEEETCFSVLGTEGFTLFVRNEGSKKQQVFSFEASVSEMMWADYEIRRQDINGDSYPDLLMVVGSSGGSGGSWSHCRCVVWKPKESRYDHFPSLPARFTFFDNINYRIVDRWDVGAWNEHLEIYELVDGEYQLTKQLYWEADLEGIYSFRYYENEVLMEELELSSMEEIIRLHPDLDYWTKG